jgi:hypothetical protein
MAGEVANAVDDSKRCASHELLLSEYERNRARNIERNNARLRALGLISVREEKVSNAAAWKTHHLYQHSEDETFPNEDARSDNNEGDDDYSEDASAHAVSRKKRKQRPSEPQASPSRKSRRLQGLTPAGGSRDCSARSPSQVGEERETRVEECRAARQAAALRYYEQCSGATKKAAKENPSATYEHCLMRVQSMTHKALANRVKVIERAAGKHCVVKMAIFKSCLQDEGLWELATLSSEALERLKALLPPPETD